MGGMRVVVAVPLLAACFVGRADAQARPGRTHKLEASPTTVAYGYYSATATPVLRIASGDVVDVTTMLTNTPERLERAGVRA